MTANSDGPGSPRRHTPVWLSVVGGPHLGDSIEVPLVGRLVLAPPDPAAPQDDSLHWDIGLAPASCTFSLAGATLTGALGPAGLCNLFDALAKDRFRAGDLLEWGEVAVLVGEGPHGLPGAITVAFANADATGDPTAPPTDWSHASIVTPVPIPRVFHSEYSGSRFATCLVCEGDLLANGVPYVIEKSYRGRETILECALCMACAAHVNGEISDESRTRLEAFGRRMMANGTGVARCRACHKPRIQAKGFNLMSTCVLDESLPPSWMVLCEQCLDGLEATLSQQTRERHRDFVTDHFPGLPADLPSPVFFA